MRRLLSLAVRLYPRRWRRRYGNELEALLEELEPNWSTLFDVLYGVMTMSMRSVSIMPIAFTALGAGMGAAISLWATPERYESSAIVRVDQPAGADVAATGMDDMQRSLELALRESGAEPTETVVELLSQPGSGLITVRLAHAAAAAAEALRVTQALAAALTAGGRGEVVNVPALPTSPVRPEYAAAGVSGALLGLVVGMLVLLLPRFRKRSALP